MTLEAAPTILIGKHKFSPDYTKLGTVLEALRELPSPFAGKEYPAPVLPVGEPFHNSIVSTLIANEDKIKAVLNPKEAPGVIKGMKTAVSKAWESSPLDIVGIIRVVQLLALNYYEDREFELVAELLKDTVNKFQERQLYAPAIELLSLTYKDLLEHEKMFYDLYFEHVSGLITELFAKAEVDPTPVNEKYKAVGMLYNLQQMIADRFLKAVNVVENEEVFRKIVEQSARNVDAQPASREFYRKCAEQPELFKEFYEIIKTNKLFMTNYQTSELAFDYIEPELAAYYRNPKRLTVKDGYLVPEGMQGHAPYIEGETKSVGLYNSTQNVYLVMRNRSTGFTSLACVTPMTEVEAIEAAIKHFKDVNANTTQEELEVLLIGGSDNPENTFKDNPTLNQPFAKKIQEEQISPVQFCLMNILEAVYKQQLKITGADLFNEDMPDALCISVAPGEIAITEGAPEHAPTYNGVFNIIRSAARESILTDIAFSEERPFVYNPLFVGQNEQTIIYGKYSLSLPQVRKDLLELNMPPIQIGTLLTENKQLHPMLRAASETTVGKPIARYLKGPGCHLNTTNNNHRINTCMRAGTKICALGEGAEQINQPLAEFINRGALFFVTERSEVEKKERPKAKDKPSITKELKPKSPSNLFGAQLKRPNIVTGGIIPNLTTKSFEANPTSLGDFNLSESAAPQTINVQRVSWKEADITRKTILAFQEVGFKAALQFSASSRYLGKTPERKELDLGTSYLETDVPPSKPAAGAAAGR